MRRPLVRIVDVAVAVFFCTGSGPQFRGDGGCQVELADSCLVGESFFFFFSFSSLVFFFSSDSRFLFISFDRQDSGGARERRHRSSRPAKTPFRGKFCAWRFPVLRRGKSAFVKWSSDRGVKGVDNCGEFAFCFRVPAKP